MPYTLICFETIMKETNNATEIMHSHTSDFLTILGLITHKLDG